MYKLMKVVLIENFVHELDSYSCEPHVDDLVHVQVVVLSPVEERHEVDVPGSHSLSSACTTVCAELCSIPVQHLVGMVSKPSVRCRQVEHVVLQSTPSKENHVDNVHHEHLHL